MKRQYTRKGMTLIEILVAIAIYAVLALLLTEIMTLVNATMRSADQLNKRLAYEAKYADNLITTGENGPFDSNDAFDKAIITYDTDSTLEAYGTEYITNYENPNASGVEYHSDLNYKFIVFGKPSDSSVATRTENFKILIVIPEAIDPANYIVVETNFVNAQYNGTSHPYEGDASRRIVLDEANYSISGNTLLTLELDVSAIDAADGAGSFTFSLFDDMVATNPATGETKTINDVEILRSTINFRTKVVKESIDGENKTILFDQAVYKLQKNSEGYLILQPQ